MKKSRGCVVCGGELFFDSSYMLWGCHTPDCDGNMDTIDKFRNSDPNLMVELDGRKFLDLARQLC